MLLSIFMAMACSADKATDTAHQDDTGHPVDTLTIRLFGSDTGGDNGATALTFSVSTELTGTKIALVEFSFDGESQESSLNFLGLKLPMLPLLIRIPQ